MSDQTLQAFSAPSPGLPISQFMLSPENRTVASAPPSSLDVLVERFFI